MIEFERFQHQPEVRIPIAGNLFKARLEIPTKSARRFILEKETLRAFWEIEVDGSFLLFTDIITFDDAVSQKYFHQKACALTYVKSAVFF
ncbi:hypothetical protein C7460_12711 [Marinoscillum furvescens DSM 4134]|uniref:Uncharacterized protein n=2 Tax=Marinoscillum furvescens TaxID=1026 RepID=A0A3D9KWY7_MARFU|nr:hypothetical protein C7460_12711 [Marinoscillum furvescens DSM 4134]